MTNMGCKKCECKPVCPSSNIGYTYLTNNVPQTVLTNGLVNPGSVVRTSCIGNVIVQGNNSMVVRDCGTYMIDVLVVGTPNATEGGSTTNGTIQLSLSVNGLIVSSPVVPVMSTNYDTQYEVRAVVNLDAGDVITISNIGSFTLTMEGSNTQGSQNVNILIEKYR